jgi:hypothetical protein
MTKILTDPFHDAKIYATSPLYLLRGQLIDPMEHIEYDEENLSSIKPS